MPSAERPEGVLVVAKIVVGIACDGRIPKDQGPGKR